MRTIAVMLLFSVSCAHPCPAPPQVPTAQAPTPPSAAAAIGETFVIPSKILGEDRVVNVYVPPGYAEGSEKYPVLYMPDGGMDEDFPHITGEVDVSIKNQVIRPMIVVGVKNTERRRDLVSATTVEEEKKTAPHAGGSDKFRRFFADELKPWVAAHYRVTAESALIGESAAGLFVIETLVTEPALFDAYIAADPSVWWNKGAVVEQAKARFADWHERPKALFVATADYKETQDGVKALLEHVPAGVTVHYVPMPEEHHSTIFPFAALRGIRTLFAMPPAAAP